jgi:antitoxin VapB
VGEFNLRFSPCEKCGNQARKTGEPLTITQNGIPFAIISPIKKKSLLETLSTLEPLDEDFADVDGRKLARTSLKS